MADFGFKQIHILKNSRTYLIANSCKFLLIVSSLLAAHGSQAQGIGNSPLSIYGIGEVYQGSFAAQQAMGGLGVANGNGVYTNHLNPALLPVKIYTSFEVGLLAQSKTLQDAKQSQQVFGANINYVNLALPLNYRWSMAIGIRPYSYVNYEVYSRKYLTTVANGVDTVDNRYIGSGGLNKATMSHGVRVGKGFYVGGEIAYIFGVIKKEAKTQIISDGQGYITDLNERYNIADVTTKLAAAYRGKLNEKWFMTFATTYDFGTNLKTQRVRTFDLFGGSSAVAAQDTLDASTTGKLSLPSTFRLGANFLKPFQFKNAMSVSLDYSYTPWSKYQNFFGKNDNLQDSYSVALGLEYTPYFLSLSNSLKRVNYRLGVNYTKTPYSFKGQSVNDFSVSTGFGIPLRNSSYINFGLTFGSRGFTENGGIQDNYTRISLGFTLTDLWFQKFKLD
jgi:hypothetical protein